MLQLSRFINTCTVKTKGLSAASTFNLSTTTTNLTPNIKEFNTSLVLDCKNTLGESPIWDYRTNMLYWIDIEDSLFFTFDPKSNNFNQYTLPERVGSFVLTKNPDIQLFAFEHGPMFYDPFKSKVIGNRLFNLNHFEERANDGRCDKQGRFVFGGSHNYYNKPISSLYRINHDLSYNILFNQSFITANSICFNNNGNKMYFSDTHAHDFRENEKPKILKYDYYEDNNKYPDNPEIFSSIDNSNNNYAYDGSIIDENDYLWNALLRSSKVIGLNPNSGDTEIIVNINEPYITCPAFGGEHLDTLYITTLSFLMDEEEKTKYKQYGGLHAVQLPFKGLKEPIFQGDIPT